MVLLTYTIQNEDKPSELVTGVVVSKKTLDEVTQELNDFGQNHFPKYKLIIIPVNAGFIQVASDLLSEEREKQDAENYLSGRYPGTTRFADVNA